MLEDFEHLFDIIACQTGNITLSVSNGVDQVSTMKVLMGLKLGGLLITSHYGCNTHGERTLFR